MTERLYRSLADSFRLEFYLPDCPLIDPPAVAYAADFQLSDIMESSTPPQAVLMDVNDDLTILAADGHVVGGIEDCMRAFKRRAYPILHFSTAETGEKIVAYADKNCLGDVTFCVSYEGRKLLNAVRKALPLSRGMLDCRGMVLPGNLLELVGECQENNATMVLFDVVPTRAEVRQLQKRFIQVWIAVNSAGCNAAEAILAGACGIITQDPKGLYALLNRFPERSTRRPTPLYAHKGLHITGEFPENTIKAAVAAGKRGYDGAEVDVLLTADDTAVIQHDFTTGSLFDADLSVSESSFEVLSNLHRKNFPDSGLDCFEELMVAMAEYPETPVIIDIKTPVDTYGVEEVVNQISELLKRVDVQKHFTCIMGLKPPYLSYIHEHLPRLSLAHCSSKMPEPPSDVDGLNLLLYQFAEKTKGTNAALNLYYPTSNSQFARLAHLRGITIFVWSGALMPWECEDLSSVFASGYDGLTSDWVTKFADFPIDIIPMLPQVCQANHPIFPAGMLRLRTGREIKADNLRVIPLGGDITLHKAGSFSGRGSVCVSLVYCGRLPDGKSLCLCSEAVMVECTMNNDIQ